MVRARIRQRSRLRDDQNISTIGTRERRKSITTDSVRCRRRWWLNEAGATMFANQSETYYYFTTRNANVSVSRFTPVPPAKPLRSRRFVVEKQLFLGESSSCLSVVLQYNAVKKPRTFRSNCCYNIEHNPYRIIPFNIETITIVYGLCRRDVFGTKVLCNTRL